MEVVNWSHKTGLSKGREPNQVVKETHICICVKKEIVDHILFRR